MFLDELIRNGNSFLVIDKVIFLFMCVYVNYYVKGCCVLVGDVVYIINLFVGQGVNLGFKDVEIFFFVCVEFKLFGSDNVLLLIDKVFF